MRKAEYSGKYYSNGYEIKEYKYRGRTYETYTHRTKGGEPLRWQHANAQARIDAEIEIEERSKNNTEKTETVEESLDYFFSLMGD